jgi:hypothetical protein
MKRHPMKSNDNMNKDFHHKKPPKTAADKEKEYNQARARIFGEELNINPSENTEILSPSSSNDELVITNKSISEVNSNMLETESSLSNGFSEKGKTNYEDESKSIANGVQNILIEKKDFLTESITTTNTDDVQTESDHTNQKNIDRFEKDSINFNVTDQSDPLKTNDILKNRSNTNKSSKSENSQKSEKSSNSNTNNDKSNSLIITTVETTVTTISETGEVESNTYVSPTTSFIVENRNENKKISNSNLNNMSNVLDEITESNHRSSSSTQDETNISRDIDPSYQSQLDQYPSETPKSKGTIDSERNSEEYVSSKLNSSPSTFSQSTKKFPSKPTLSKQGSDKSINLSRHHSSDSITMSADSSKSHSTNPSPKRNPLFDNPNQSFSSYNNNNNSYQQNRSLNSSSGKKIVDVTQWKEVKYTARDKDAEKSDPDFTRRNIPHASPSKGFSQNNQNISGSNVSYNQYPPKPLNMSNIDSNIHPLSMNNNIPKTTYPPPLQQPMGYSQEGMDPRIVTVSAVPMYPHMQIQPMAHNVVPIQPNMQPTYVISPTNHMSMNQPNMNYQPIYPAPNQQMQMSPNNMSTPWVQAHMPPNVAPINMAAMNQYYPQSSQGHITMAPMYPNSYPPNNSSMPMMNQYPQGSYEYMQPSTNPNQPVGYFPGLPGQYPMSSSSSRSSPPHSLQNSTNSNYSHNHNYAPNYINNNTNQNSSNYQSRNDQRNDSRNQGIDSVHSSRDKKVRKGGNNSGKP